MRVALLERYGPPDVVRVAARPMPVPGAGEMVVRVAATSVGASDAAARSGTPAVVRLFSGLRRPRIRVLGGVQLARHAGAHVTGVTSTKNIELVRGLGADEVIDYTADDFTASAQRWDVVFDAIGTAGFRRARRVLAPGGLYLSTQPDASVFYALVSRRARVAFTGLRTDAAKRPDLAELAALAAAGTLVPVIDGGYPLAAAAAAHARVDTGHKRGTVVLHPQD